MNIYAKPGTKIRGIFKYGRLQHGHDREKIQAMKYIIEGVEYTVDHTDVHNFHTDVYLKEFPGVPFNSVHFIDDEDRLKFEAELAYEQAKKNIAEIKEIQQNIGKLIAEIRELALGFNPNKIVGQKQ